jgi:hypothetical protein
MTEGTWPAVRSIETLLAQLGVDQSDQSMVRVLEISRMERAGTASAEHKEEFRRILKGMINKGRARISFTMVSLHDPRLLHPDCFRDRAKEAGIDETDPALMRAVKALEEWEVGTITGEDMDPAFEELDAALDAFIEAHKNK